MIAFAIKNGRKWAEKNKKVRYFEITYPIPEYPHEFLLTDENFRTLWYALGLPGKPTKKGAIDGRIILDALRGFDESLLVKPPQHFRDTSDNGHVDNGGTVVFLNVTQQKAARYVAQLTAIAEEAVKREEKVIWF